MQHCLYNNYMRMIFAILTDCSVTIPVVVIIIFPVVAMTLYDQTVTCFINGRRACA